jgi:hypothetical protein
LGALARNRGVSTVTAHLARAMAALRAELADVIEQEQR